VIENKNLISSYEFAKISDQIFSGVFTQSQLNELLIKDYKIVHSDDNFLYIRNLKFEIKENDIIFCRTEDVKILFTLIGNCKLNNIKLITHQSDQQINKKLYLKKPKCISEWYSTNINYYAENLISIPIGLANEHPKNLSKFDFKSRSTENHFFNNTFKKYLLFINFQESTNYKVRAGLYTLYKNFNWALVKSPNLKKLEYLNILEKSDFTLAPFGNGYDTHRVWEALYSQSVPIVKKHISFSCLKDLPVLQIEDIQDITYGDLITAKAKLESDSHRYEKLYMGYWEELINKNKIQTVGSFLVVFTGIKVNIFEFKFRISHRLHSKKKVLKYFFRRIVNLVVNK
jgi:hypothetical protein